MPLKFKKLYRKVVAAFNFIHPFMKGTIMGSFSNYLENALLNHVFGSGDAAANAVHDMAHPSKYVALCTAAVVDSDDGAAITEVADANAYARTRCETWTVSSAGAISNTGPITFPQATGAWGKILDFAIMDGNTHGADDVLAYGTLTISKSVESGDTPKFASGDLDITLS